MGRWGDGEMGRWEPFTAWFLLILDVKKGGLFMAFFL